MTTKTFLALLLGSISMLPLRVAADPTPTAPNNLYRSLESGSPTHPAAKLHGTIESIDYAGGNMVVRTGRGSQVVAILPSTAIYGAGGYAGLSDLRRGQSVEISVYEVDGRLVAQSIRLK